MYGLNNTLYLKSVTSGQLLVWEGKQNVYSKDRREGKEPPITQTAWVKLEGQSVVMSS